MFNLASFGLGFIAGFGTGFVSREIVSASKTALKPLAKEFMRASMQVVEKGREAVAHVGEAIEDLVAEVRTESQRAQENKVAPSKKKKAAAAKA